MVQTKRSSAFSTKQLVGLLVGVSLYTVVMVWPMQDDSTRSILAILALVGTLWILEVFPLFVTALLIPILLVLTTPLTEKQVLAPFFDPVIALFLGSFVMAVALEKHGVAHRAATATIKVFGKSARLLLLGLLIITAFFGMWISNTATVAFLLPIALAIIRVNRLKQLAPNLGKALLFALTFGAAIGGMATIVGTPPNALAVDFLAQNGMTVSFLGWLKPGLVIALLLVPLAWLVLITRLRPEISKLKLTYTQKKWSKPEVMTVLIGILVIVLWLLEPMHGIHPGIVALGGAVAVFATGLLEQRDLSKVPFSALLLFGGGLALGQAMLTLGLADQLANALENTFGGLSQPVLALALIAIGVALTTVASNTATAAFLIPVIISLANIQGFDARMLVIPATLALSIDFISPIGTPAAAMIHDAGELRVWDFIRVGLPLTVMAALVVYLVTLLLL